MRTIEEFLFYLCDLDIKLWVEDERLHCNAPKNALTPLLKTELANRKDEIKAFLRQNNIASTLKNKSIRPVPREKNIPLSFAQQRLWFIDQLEPASSIYNIPIALHLKGSLNVAALLQTFNEIVKRHETLRTTFASVKGQPIQIISPSLTLTLPIVNLQKLNEVNKREAEVQRLISNEARRPFNLAQGPLLRVTLLLLNEEEYIVILIMHHIVSDGWSMGILIQEVAALYKAFCEGKPSPLPELPIQYADFAVWQQEWLQGEVLQAHITYWKQQLKNLPVIKLPIDRRHQNIQTNQEAKQSVILSKSLHNQLKYLSARQGATLFMTLLSAFQIVLHYHTGQNDIVVGTDVANRNQSDTEQLIGFFVNQLVLRTDLSGNPTFLELLDKVREVTLKAYAHQDMPFDKLVSVLNPERHLNRTLLFQVKLILENAQTSSLELSGLTINPIHIPKETAQLDLILRIVETEEGMNSALEYNADLFNTNTIVQMLVHFETLLNQVVVHPTVRLNELVEIIKVVDKQQQDIEKMKRKKQLQGKLKTRMINPQQT